MWLGLTPASSRARSTTAWAAAVSLPFGFGGADNEEICHERDVAQVEDDQIGGQLSPSASKAKRPGCRVQNIPLLKMAVSVKGPIIRCAGKACKQPIGGIYCWQGMATQTLPSRRRPFRTRRAFSYSDHEPEVSARLAELESTVAARSPAW